MYCKECGSQISNDAKFCPYCGTRQIDVNKAEDPFEKYYDDPTSNATVNANYQPRSRVAAGLLGILLGYLGIHNFYLGYNEKAVAQLLLTVVGWVVVIGPMIAVIWGLIEGIMILTGSMNEDAKGYKLVD